MKMVNSLKPLTIVTKGSILDVAAVLHLPLNCGQVLLCTISWKDDQWPHTISLTNGRLDLTNKNHWMKKFLWRQNIIAWIKIYFFAWKKTKTDGNEKWVNTNTCWLNKNIKIFFLFAWQNIINSFFFTDLLQI